MKKIFKIIAYPILLIIIEFILIFVFSLFFNFTTSLEVNTLEYNLELSNFLNNNKIFITVLSFLLLIPILIRKIKMPTKKINNISLLIMIGVTFSLVYNLLIFSLNKIFNFTNMFDVSEISIIINLISVGIIGPILEELVFRGIVYERLRINNSKRKSVILTGLLFGILHGNIIQFIYAFIFNFILINVYDEEKNIFAPIIMHVSANSSLILLLSIIKKLNIYSSLLILVIFLIILLVLLNKYNDCRHNNNVNNS